jgi:hypothetical protein
MKMRKRANNSCLTCRIAEDTNGSLKSNQRLIIPFPCDNTLPSHLAWAEPTEETCILDAVKSLERVREMSAPP